MKNGILRKMRPNSAESGRTTGVLARFLCVFMLLLPTIPAQSGGISFQSKLQDAIGEHIENQLEEQVGGDIEDDVEDSVTDDIEDSIEDQVTDAVDDALQDDLEDAVADAVEEVIEERIADTVQEAVEENIEESIASAVEEGIDENIESYAEQSVEQDIEDNILESVLESIIDSTEEQLEARLDSPERVVSRQEWLVMAEDGALEALAEAGYVFDRVTRLEGLGLQLAEVSAPASFDISEVREGVLDVVGSDLAQVDINHLYTAGAPVPSSQAGYAPQEVLDFPEDTLGLSMRIGMIDTAVDATHPAFSQSSIQSKHFGRDASNSPSFHGTAIASMLSADSPDYQGIAPASHLYAASVFERDSNNGEVASTASLVKALDWLTREQVEVINMSLAGPPNRLLQAVLKRVSEKGIPVLAAAGNAGPASAPLYPAAYDSVVAITAVEADGRVFRLANRGEYLDLAAPGVNIRHAQAGGGYVVSSGTSFAVPFASVAVARLRSQADAGDVLTQLYRSAHDLGPPGKDDIYGYGLLDPAGVVLPTIDELASSNVLSVVGAL
jgi:hypothetical protein